ncbi:MAG: alpha/beta fold hydrolase [Spirochaetaceae bacterium]|nr:alpha/beta fold hydrolase [Spirochaetaceae bacterium]
MKITYIKKIIRYSGLIVLALLCTLITVLAVNTASEPDMQPWHDMRFPADKPDYSSFSTFEQYLTAERNYLDNIFNSLAVDSTQEFSKYTEDDVFSPLVDGKNLNGSFVLEPSEDEFKGGVLLVHGLSDSPYHMLEIGKSLSRAGYYVIGIRLPGHGTLPAALLDICWQDWYEAVEFAAGFVKEEIRKQGRGDFIMGGFSTGAALNLRYTMERILDGSERLPGKLLFFSPAFGITPFAEFVNLHKIISWIPLFKKTEWQNIEPEYDPFRYTSWPYNAGYQIYRLTKKNWNLIRRISSNQEYLKKIPPMITFQSRLDATVIPEKVYELYEKIAPEGSQLFLFDVNKRYQSIIPDNVLEWTPDSIHGGRVKDMIRMIPSDGKWPESVYAISHISVPLSPVDAVYGEDSLIGGLSIKGEKGVLETSINLDRLRYNPFFPYMEEQILDFLSR